MSRSYLPMFVTAIVVALAAVSLLFPTAQAQDKPNLEVASTPKFRGEASLLHPKQDKSFDFVFVYHVDPESFQGTLVISPKDEQADLKGYEYSPEVGQEFLMAIYPKHFDDVGTLICAEWASGAVSQKLTVYRLSPEGRIETAFEGACRFGFQIIDVTGDGVPDICGCDGDVGPSKKKLSVYAWNGTSFQISKTIDVAVPHAYAVQSASPTERQP